MIIEIRKTNFVNKGAELMLHAVLGRLRQQYPEAMLAMAPAFQDYQKDPYSGFLKRAELGILQKSWLWRYGIQWGDVAAVVPGILRKMYGITLDSEIDVIIDAAGFAYSDQWGHSQAVELAHSCRRWRKRGGKIILLPQAFGPFTSKKIIAAMKVVADSADLIFARETISYTNLVDVVGERSNIKIAPDFTNLIDGVVPGYFEDCSGQFCIIPNNRMIDMVSRAQSEAYLPFMVSCVKYLMAKGVIPFLLVHEGEDDLMLAKKIREATSGELMIISEDHPLKIKGIIGASAGVIGSRFHGLVSALSQGVPSLSTGWSHKYQMLFEDYGLDDCLLDCLAPNEEMQRKIDLIVVPESRTHIQGKLNEKSKQIKKLSEEMWQDVFKTIGCCF